MSVFDLTEHAGRLHPRHAAAPADQVLPDRAGEGAGRARARDRGARRDPRRRRSCCGRSSPTSWPRWPRRTARPGARCCWSRPAPPSPRPPAPLEVADDPCFACLSSTGLLARTATTSRPATGGGRAKHDVVVSAVRTTARGEVGVVTSRGPAAPARRPRPAGAARDRQRPATCRAALPLSELLSLEPGERALALTLARHRRPGARARHPPGRGQAGQPRGARQRTSGTSSASRRRRGGRRGRAGHRRRDAVFVTSDAQLLHFAADAVARRAARAAAWPASGWPPASGWSSSARSTPPTARWW